jgi:hypothetical protein
VVFGRCGQLGGSGSSVAMLGGAKGSWLLLAMGRPLRCCGDSGCGLSFL